MKNIVNELKLWSKDDIVPSDLQEICLKAAKKIESLEEDSKMLEALNAVGVDNWEGYDIAFDIFTGREPLY